MPYTLKLDYFSNDLRINSSGHFERISGEEEICQRVRIALRHEFSEYFLNRLSGIPYYGSNQDRTNILGNKENNQFFCNLLRKKISAVPGVLQVLKPSIIRIGRSYYFSCSIIVQKDEEIDYGSEYEITNIEIAA